MKVWELKYAMLYLDPHSDVECLDAGIVISKDEKQTHLINVPTPEVQNEKISKNIDLSEVPNFPLPDVG